VGAQNEVRLFESYWVNTAPFKFLYGRSFNSTTEGELQMISSFRGSPMVMLILVWVLLQREDASCITDVSKILMCSLQQHRPQQQEAWLKNRKNNKNGGFSWHSHTTST
jgi:hypothetical protein